MKKYVVRLEADDRKRLQQLVHAGKAAAYRIRHANVLLAVDESKQGSIPAPPPRTADADTRLPERLRQTPGPLPDRSVPALERKKQVRPSVEKMFDGEKEAKLIAIACDPRPPGRARWTLELLADRVVTLKIVERCSPQTVMRTLKKKS